MAVEHVLTVKLDHTKATFEFDGYDPFIGRMTRPAHPIIIVSEDSDTSPFALVISDRGQGAYSVTASFDGWVKPAFYTLSCEVP
jgi:hypothetical protein